MPADVAVLHATTISFTSRRSRNAPISRANPRTCASGRGPYGRRAWSPRYTKSSCGIVTRHSCRTVRPPTPESNTPTGRESMPGDAIAATGSDRVEAVRRLLPLVAAAFFLLPAGHAAAADFTKIDTRGT